MPSPHPVLAQLVAEGGGLHAERGGGGRLVAVGNAQGTLQKFALGLMDGRLEIADWHRLGWNALNGGAVAPAAPLSVSRNFLSP